MKIGILGTGDVGRALGTGFAALGHDVLMGSRDASNAKAREWAMGAGPRAKTGTFHDAAKFGEVIVLATAWEGTENAIRMATPEAIGTKVVMDATNPLEFPENAPPRLKIGHTDSSGEQVQRWLPKARVVKVYNTVGYALMVDPKLPGGPPDMFLCGNDDAAKRTVVEICASFGWPTIDIGGIEGSRLLDPLCLLWIVIAMRTKSRGHAFKVLRA